MNVPRQTARSVQFLWWGVEPEEGEPEEGEPEEGEDMLRNTTTSGCGYKRLCVLPAFCTLAA
jgi:hypothetical protein